MKLIDRYKGSLIGVHTGDSIGAPYETMNRKQVLADLKNEEVSLSLITLILGILTETVRHYQLVDRLMTRTKLPTWQLVSSSIKD